MSITGAFQSSRSGLAATSAWSETTANNIANANTEGYTRKEATLVTRTLGGSSTVQVSGIEREVNASLDRMHRQEMSRMGTQEATATALEGYSAALGQPDDPQSLTARFTAVQNAYDALSADPGALSLQRGALEAATDMARSLNSLSQTLARTGEDVRGAILNDVSTLNRTLSEIADLNVRVAQTAGSTAQRAALEDEIAKRIDAIAPMMELTVRAEGDGRVNLYTTGGAPLVEGNKAQTVGYDRFSGELTAAGLDITPTADGSRSFSEGRLVGLIRLTETTLPKFQLQLDETARALVEGFAAADDTVAAGQPGLFTDGQGGFDPAALEGLAGRIEVNAAADPAAGGALWRIRDGMGAGAPGPAGDGTRVGAVIDMLAGAQAFDGATGLGSGIPMIDYMAGMVADQQVTRTSALDRLDEATITARSVEAARSGVSGVNIDDELQQLIVIEQSYAANSRVMSAVADMLDSLIAAV